MAGAISSPRLFLALWPDEAARAALASWRDHWQWPAGAVPTGTDKLHLTLHFLGPVALELHTALDAQLRAVAAPHAFTLDFGRAELWSGGTAVVCPLALPEPLQSLHAKLAGVLQQLGLPVEQRPFRPHVTLARKARQAAVPPEGPIVQWRVGNGFALAQSMPAGQGYRVLQRFG